MSWAVTVALTGVPAVAVAGALTANLDPAEVISAAMTRMSLEVPLASIVTESAADTVLVPAVFSVTVKVPVPLVRVLSAGSVAVPSVEVKCTVPE